ncbi:MAG: MBL fold metallo-hydrolase [Actinocatenispora sp.]
MDPTAFNPRRVRRDIEAARRSHGGRIWPESFADRLTDPLPTLRDVARLARTANPWATGDDPDRIPVHRGGLPAVPRTGATVTWVGHATFVVQVGGLRVLTDPVWSRRVPGIRPRYVPPGVAFADLRHVDAVLISHNHYDHLDAPTIRRLPRETPMFVPAALGYWFRRRGFRSVVELDWWESSTVGDVRFDFVPSHHWSRRGLHDSCKSLWGGWVITGPADERLYFAGDTGYGHWFGRIAAAHPGIDVAMLPIGAYHPRWFMRPVHMNPEEAVRACADLGATSLATMHWGTFAMTAEPAIEPLTRVRAAWESTGRPRDQLWDLPIGGTGFLPAP